MRTAAGLALLLVAVPAAALAHGGGLDSYGCHHNRKAGGYHCHRGPLAGQHFETKEQMMRALPRDPVGAFPSGAPVRPGLPTQPQR